MNEWQYWPHTYRVKIRSQGALAIALHVCAFKLAFAQWPWTINRFATQQMLEASRACRMTLWVANLLGISADGCDAVFQWIPVWSFHSRWISSPLVRWCSGIADRTVACLGGHQFVMHPKGTISELSQASDKEVVLSLIMSNHRVFSAQFYWVI